MKGLFIMAQKLGLYRCNICGNIAEIVIEGYGELVCCGQEMEYLEAGVTDGSAEKHVPYIEEADGNTVIRIGSLPHPMIPEHYIEFVEAISKDGRYLKRKYLYPGESPEMVIKCMDKNKLWAREYCNIHGLWKNDNN